MAFVFSASWFGAAAFSGNSVTIASGTNIASGSLALVFVACSPATRSVVSISDTASPSNNYTFCPGSSDTSVRAVSLYYSRNSRPAVNVQVTVTMDGAVTDLRAELAVFTGAALNSPFDKASVGSGSGVSLSAASITPAGSGELSVSFGAETAWTGTPGTGYTAYDNEIDVWGEYNLSVSTAQIGDWSSNVNQSWQVVQALFSTTDISSGARMLASLGIGT